MKELDALYRAQFGRLVAAVLRRTGHARLDWAESAVQEAFARAAGLDAPLKNPEGWLYRVALNLVRDFARRERSVPLEEEALVEDTFLEKGARLAGEWDDDVLRIIFAVCDEALTRDEQLSLALRIVCGVEVEAIAALFLTSVETVKKRLQRAKQKYRGAAPSLDRSIAECSGRLEAVLGVLYGVFAEGSKQRRFELCWEAIRLVEGVQRQWPEAAPSVEALLALMKLSAARFPARVTTEGSLVLLEHQDRRLWDSRLIDSGLVHLSQSAVGEQVDPVHLEAAISACHCIAENFASTDWGRIVGFYDRLLAIRPSVVFVVNRAVAIGFRDGAAAGVEALEGVDRGQVSGYMPFFAALGSLYGRMGRRDDAASAYRVAYNLSRNEVDRAFFRARIEDATSLKV